MLTLNTIYYFLQFSRLVFIRQMAQFKLVQTLFPSIKRHINIPIAQKFASTHNRFKLSTVNEKGITTFRIICTNDG